MSLGFAHFKFSVDRYQQMIDSGILTENDRVELIRGELLDKMPIGNAHAEAVNRLTRFFSGNLEDSVTISVQNPLVLADSEPEPDVVLFTSQSGGKPRAGDVHLVIEVADSSLEFDRTVKLPLYAQAGIRELWIVNLIDSRMETYRQPQLDGTYAAGCHLVPGDEVQPLAFPNVSLLVSQVLP